MAQTTPDALSPNQLAESLTRMPGWHLCGMAIAQIFRCKGFEQAIALVNAAAALAQKLDHHPDILVEYDQVTFTLSSHDVGGVTRRDLELARAIDEAALELEAEPARNGLGLPLQA